jgi:hypothetical protein
MPSGGSIPGEIALNARPRSPLARGRDGIFPVARIISGPPMADAVVAVTIFHQHSQACLPCSAIVKVIMASSAS